MIRVAILALLTIDPLSGWRLRPSHLEPSEWRDGVLRRVNAWGVCEEWREGVVRRCQQEGAP